MANVLMKSDKACGRCPFVLNCMRAEPLCPERSRGFTICHTCGMVHFKHAYDKMFCPHLREGKHHPVHVFESTITLGAGELTAFPDLAKMKFMKIFAAVHPDPMRIMAMMHYEHEPVMFPAEQQTQEEAEAYFATHLTRKYEEEARARMHRAFDIDFIGGCLFFNSTHPGIRAEAQSLGEEVMDADDLEGDGMGNAIYLTPPGDCLNVTKFNKIY